MDGLVYQALRNSFYRFVKNLNSEKNTHKNKNLKNQNSIIMNENIYLLYKFIT